MKYREKIEEIIGRLGNGLTGNEAVDAIMAIVYKAREDGYDQGRNEGNDEAYYDIGR